VYSLNLLGGQRRDVIGERAEEREFDPLGDSLYLGRQQYRGNTTHEFGHSNRARLLAQPTARALSSGPPADTYIDLMRHNTRLLAAAMQQVILQRKSEAPQASGYLQTNKRRPHVPIAPRLLPHLRRARRRGVHIADGS
jgi:hypothetical protein